MKSKDEQIADLKLQHEAKRSLLKDTREHLEKVKKQEDLTRGELRFYIQKSTELEGRLSDLGKTKEQFLEEWEDCNKDRLLAVKRLQAIQKHFQSEAFLDKLAEFEHIQWVGWMLYEKDAPLWKRKNWDRLTKTRYDKLTETEKESDKAIALKVVRLIERELAVLLKEGEVEK